MGTPSHLAVDAAERQPEHNEWAEGFFKATALLAIKAGVGDPLPEWGQPVVA